jgi:hypothetical protein
MSDYNQVEELGASSDSEIASPATLAGAPGNHKNYGEAVEFTT